MLSDDQRHRLEQEKQSLEQDYELQSKKIATIRRALIIETDASVKFKYEQQIQVEGKELESITRRLDEIEKQIQAKNQSIELSKYSDLPVQVSTPINVPQQSMRILHLSDLHFGSSTDAHLWHGQLVEDLQRNLGVHKLDALILSGDIANRSTSEEYQAAIEFVNELRQDFSLNAEQIIIVPGNHDLNWELSRQAYVLKDRDRCQPNELEEGCYIPLTDDAVRVIQQEKYPQRFIKFKSFYDRYKASIKPYSLESSQQYSLDIIGNDILVVGLNSAWQIDHHYRDRANINTYALTNALNEIRRTELYNNSRIKIAVWHHPINSSHEDRIRDGDFLQRLAVNDFQLFLHGHVHRAENDEFRYDQNKDGRKLSRICAGTFGSPTRSLNTGIPWQYNLLTFTDDKVRVDTRKRESINGAWEGDYRWRRGNEQSLSYYEIDLQATGQSTVPPRDNNVSHPTGKVKKPPETGKNTKPTKDKFQFERIILIFLGVGVFIFVAKVAIDYCLSIIYPNNPATTVNNCGGEVGNSDNTSNLIFPQKKGLTSSGENLLLGDLHNSDLVIKGIEAFKKAESDNNYDPAIGLFNQAINKYPNNPEPYIYRNNALARQRSRSEDRKLYVLAAAIPASSDKSRYRAEEMLRGIADAQTCFNDKKKANNCLPPNSKQNLLEIKLADDGNIEEVAKNTAIKITEDPRIVGIIGHYASGTTQKVIPIYSNENNLIPNQIPMPIISPASTSSNLNGSVFFRTISSSKMLGEKLADYVKNQGVKKVFIFYDFSDFYSNSLWSDFNESLKSRGIDYKGIKLKADYQDVQQKKADYQDVQQKIEEFTSGKNFAAMVIPPSAPTDGNSEANDKSLDIATNIVNQLSKTKTNGNLVLGGNFFYTAKTLRQKDSSFKNMILVVPWFAEAFPNSDIFYATRAKKVWGGQVSWATAGSYDATQAFMSALSSIDDTTDNNQVRAKLINRLKDVDLPSSYTSGSQLRFNNNEATRDPFLVRVIEGKTCSSTKRGFVFQLIK
jgi:ABC-type branched-subunit amino acid transport system substrate-binding protein/predicted MPP superfamily phosphohydrolase